MNKAQQIIQPLIDAAVAATDVTHKGYDGRFTDGHRDGLTDAFNALNALNAITDAITLADVPAVEWVTVGSGLLTYEQHGTSNVHHGADYAVAIHDGRSTYATSKDKAKRYVEIRIHLADIERKLLAELAGT